MLAPIDQRLLPGITEERAREANQARSGSACNGCIAVIEVGPGVESGADPS